MTTVTTTRTGATRIVLAGAVGNVLEWYDFAIYGYFAAEIGRTFFPKEQAVAQVLAAFGIFAVGYLMRPIGGALIGRLGDKLGRRAALTVSVAAMAVPTFLIGILPGYEVLGIAAPVLLTVLRMVQGLSVGGEFTTSIVFGVEHAPPGRRGLVGALVACGSVGGILLGSATGAALAALMPPEALQAWGWRIPFLIGLAVGLAGFLLRRHSQEAPRPGVAERSPFLDVVRSHRPLLARLAGLAAFNAAGFYLVFVYVVSWLQMTDGMAPAQALEINTASMMTLLPVMVGAGWLSDRIGRKPVLLGATTIGFLGAVPLFWLMHHPDVGLIVLGQMGFVAAIGLFLGAQPSFLVEAAPAAVRCTAVALGYNVAVGIIGGTSPMAATWLVHRTGNDLSPAFLVMIAAAVSFYSVLRYRETSRMVLEVA